MNVAQLLSEMALDVHAVETPDETLQRIGAFAKVAVGADEAGLLLMHARKVVTVSATSSDVEKLHDSQAETNEGPGFDAVFEGATLYRSNDLRTDPRWPRWAPHAADLGYRSLLSVRLETRDRRLGSLNAYAAEPNRFSLEDEQTLGFLASHASVAIASASRGRQLEEALDSRTIISQAQGVLMLAFSLDADGAFAYLRRLSQSENAKLVTIARRVVEERETLRNGLGATS